MAIADEKYTRCPGCQTIFRVTARQLDSRGGQVRCGQCQTVFDGSAEQIVLAPLPRVPGTGDDTEQPVVVPPPLTVRGGQAPAPTPDQGGQRTADRRHAEQEAEEIAYEERFAWGNRRPRRAAAIVYAVGTPILFLALIGHTLFYYRDLIAARWPTTKPTLVALCDFAGCAVSPVADGNALGIESDLQADPARRGLLTLTATIRNRATWSLAYPHLELTLTDIQDRPVVRRAFAPSEYAGASADLANGIPPNGEIAARMYIDASATTQAGYRVYLFYP